MNLTRFDQIFSKLDPRYLTGWECGFVLSLLDKIESGENLSSAELEVFEQIYSRSMRLM